MHAIRRVHALTVTLLAALLALTTTTLSAGPAAAAVPDHWSSGSSFSSSTYHDPLSTTTGARVQAWIDWVPWSPGYKHSIVLKTTDTSSDGHHAVAQLRYSVYISGTWSTKTAFVEAAAAKGGYLTSTTYHAVSRYPMKDVHVRACVREGTVVVRCDSAFR
jgi:hypothetical protein